MKETKYFVKPRGLLVLMIAEPILIILIDLLIFVTSDSRMVKVFLIDDIGAINWAFPSFELFLLKSLIIPLLFIVFVSELTCRGEHRFWQRCLWTVSSAGAFFLISLTDAFVFDNLIMQIRLFANHHYLLGNHIMFTLSVQMRMVWIGLVAILNLLRQLTYAKKKSGAVFIFSGLVLSLIAQISLWFVAFNLYGRAVEGMITYCLQLMPILLSCLFLFYSGHSFGKKGLIATISVFFFFELIWFIFSFPENMDNLYFFLQQMNSWRLFPWVNVRLLPHVDIFTVILIYYPALFGGLISFSAHCLGIGIADKLYHQAPSPENPKDSQVSPA